MQCAPPQKKSDGKAQYQAYFSSFVDTFTNSIQECIKINMEMPRPATLTNFWVRKTRVGSKMFYNDKIAELESSEQAFSAFFMQISLT